MKLVSYFLTAASIFSQVHSFEDALSAIIFLMAASMSALSEGAADAMAIAVVG